MSNPTTVYLPVPVSEKPERDGYYIVIAHEHEAIGVLRFKDEKWTEWYLNIKAWLKPIQVSEESPVSKIIDFVEFHWGSEPLNPAGNMAVLIAQVKKALPADLSRSTYIKQLEDKVSKLEMQNDHLEEGCNERDKELVDLRESYGNVCKTVSELQIQLGNALAEVNRLKKEKENIQPLLRELERIAKVYGYQETVDVINDYNEKQNK